MPKRKDGFYWIKQFEEEGWTVASYDHPFFCEHSFAPGLNLWEEEIEVIGPYIPEPEL